MRPARSATTYYVNLNYICNERCTFCASDWTGTLRIDGKAPRVTLEDVMRWVGDTPPGQDDRIMLAGGEPTLHRDLFPIVRALGKSCRDVVLFTNGLRLAVPSYARDAVEAGITRFEIALFGSTAAAHEAITRTPGSFERTLTALNTLAALRRDHDFTIEARLLFSRQSTPKNAAIVRLLRERAPGIDAVSLNRLILSDNARAVDATISWDEARPAINEVAGLVRDHGYELVFGAIPLCLFEGDNAVFVQDQIARLRERMMMGLEPIPRDFRYFDPVVAAGLRVHSPSSSSLATPAPCRSCAYLDTCGRVEDWYMERYGHAGLRTLWVGQPAIMREGAEP